jgi:predicted enzyme related to lactoylglutathione lyase
MPGRFHELSITTADIRASLEFYESLGFWQAPTGDAWPHPYAVVTDGRVVLGLHAAPDFSALTFIDPDLAAVADALVAAGVTLSVRHTEAEVFNRIEFIDPAGQKIRMLAARTFSPAEPRPHTASACGYFAHYSMPVRDPDRVAPFWESLGFVAMPPQSQPYAHQSLTSDGIDLALHSPLLLPAPALAFCEEDMLTKTDHLRAAGVRFDSALPRTLAADGAALLVAPEGTLLVLLTGTL